MSCVINSSLKYAADSKSADLRVLGVRLPLPAPVISSFETNTWPSFHSSGNSVPSSAEYVLYALQQCARGGEIPELGDLGQCFVDSGVATTIQPCRNQDWRPTHARQAMHQQVSATDADRHRKHNVVELLRRDRARVCDWDVDVSDFRSSVNRLFPAERNHGCDALRIRTSQSLRIFEIAEIEPFPNPRHLFPLSRAAASLRPGVRNRPSFPSQ